VTIFSRSERRAWFNRDYETSSPDELINQLFDDFRFEEFIESGDVDLDAEEKTAARDFSCLSPQATIDDPRWIEIRTAARRLWRRSSR